MRKFIIGLVAGIGFMMGGVSNANAQVSWVWPQNFPSVGTTKQDFMNWLNNERNKKGLASIGYDASLETDCHQNNLLQQIYGCGHYFMGRARRQNASAVPEFGKVGPCWVVSPGHYDALFDPTIRFFAITQYGVYTTFSAY